MKISENGKRFIQKEEGFRADPYICLAGKKTIGFGHVIKPSEKLTRLALNQAIELFNQDIIEFETDLNRTIDETKLKQYQYDAIISLIFNAGIGSCPKALTAVRNNDLYTAAIEMFSVEKGVNKITTSKGRGRSKALTARRLREAAMFMGDDNIFRDWKTFDYDGINRKLNERNWSLI